MEFALLIASTICFGIACVTSWQALRQDRRASAWTRIGFMAAGFAFQCGFLYLRGEAHGRCPLTSGFERLIFVSWSITLIYFVVGTAFRLSLLGFFTAPLLVLIQGISLLIFHPVDGQVTRSSQPDYWLELHASLALISYGAFALAFVAGIMFLIQDRYLRSGRQGVFFHYLPPVHYLTQAIGRLLWFGFLLLTVGILTAFMMDSFPGTQKIVAISLVWLAYGVVIVMRSARNLGGRRLATVAMLAFAFPILSSLFL